MNKHQDRYPDILEDVLGERLYKRCKERGISDNRMMSWYHTLGRDKKLTQIRVKDALDATKKVDQQLDAFIQALEQQIEKLQQIKKGTVEDMVYKE